MFFCRSIVMATMEKNMTAIRVDDEILVVDSGLMFPEEDMLGIDLVIPDIT